MRYKFVINVECLLGILNFDIDTEYTIFYMGDVATCSHLILHILFTVSMSEWRSPSVYTQARSQRKHGHSWA